MSHSLGLQRDVGCRLGSNEAQPERLRLRVCSLILSQRIVPELGSSVRPKEKTVLGSE